MSPDLLMRCWNLQRLSNKTKGTTIFICFLPRPALLPLPTPLPTVTETPPRVSLGPSSWLKGFHQPLSPWASLRYGANQNPNSGKVDCSVYVTVRASTGPSTGSWREILFYEPHRTPSACMCAHTCTPVCTHTHTLCPLVSEP